MFSTRETSERPIPSEKRLFPSATVRAIAAIGKVLIKLGYLLYELSTAFSDFDETLTKLCPSRVISGVLDSRRREFADKSRTMQYLMY